MTHTQKVLALLSDGEPHSHHSLYALNVIAHSRVSDLRKKGYAISMWREDETYWYRLDSAPEPSGIALMQPPPSDPFAAASGAEQLALGYDLHEGARILSERFAA